MLGSYTAAQSVRRGEGGWETYAAYSAHPVELPGCRMIQLDIRDPGSVSDAMAEIRPDVVIHSAAAVRPDACEQQKADAFGINVLGTYNVLAAAKQVSAHLVHVSTDLVFNGEHNPFRPEDPVCPVNYYGLTKAAAEAAVVTADTDWAIVRTTTLYGPRMFPNLNSFSDKVIESLRSGQPVLGYVDEYRPSVPVWNVADVLLEIAERRLTGIYHAVSPDVTTRYQFARKIAEAFGLDESLIKPVSMAEAGVIALRPKVLILDISETASTLTTRLLGFEEGIRELLKRQEWCRGWDHPAL